MPIFRRGKYGAKPTVYNGVRYHSFREAEYARQLDSLRRAEDKSERVVDVKRQVKVPLVVNGALVATWYVDFLVTYADGRELWTEVKGYATRDFVIKRRLFSALFPERKLLIVR